MQQSTKKIFSLMMVLIMVLTLISGCAKEEVPATSSTATDSTTTTTPTDASEEKKYEEFLTVDVFSAQANYQGIQTGWFADVVKEKFNMELNIIAPNVAGGGDTLFQTRSAAGNLGDIVMIGSENGRLADVVKAELLYDLTDLVGKSANISKYPAATDMLKNLIGSDRIYAIPSSVSSKKATEPSEGLELTFGPYVRWDYYTSIGSPKMSTLEDLLPVLKDMQEAFPTSDSGKQTYAFSLFKDWDGNMMTLAKQPTCFYGYDEIGFVLSRADGSDDQSIIESDGQYVRALNLYFQANQMGILDPESATQNWDTLYAKMQDGAVLFSPWPWLGQAAYNTIDNKAAGKGFMLAPIDDMQIFSYGSTPTGAKYVVGVGANAKDPERMVDFIDWLFSPEGIMVSCSQTAGTCGPEGLTWNMVDGRPELTEFGQEALLNGDATMPEEWGGGSWKDGTSQLNFTTILPTDINPENGFSYNYTLWESVLELNSTPLDQSWQEKNNALTTLEYLTNNNQYVVAPGTDFIQPSEPSEISTLRAQCNSIIKENSWKMVYAKDQAEFDALLKNMQDTVIGLGYEDVLAYDMDIASQQNAARAKARQ
jgi:putative aldouronate transport system substrate-binding protein